MLLNVLLHYRHITLFVFLLASFAKGNDTLGSSALHKSEIKSVPINENSETTRLVFEVNGEIDYNDTLESMIARSGGDTSISYAVIKDGAPVGVLYMRDLVKALVPRAITSSHQ